MSIFKTKENKRQHKSNSNLCVT